MKVLLVLRISTVGLRITPTRGSSLLDRYHGGDQLILHAALLCSGEWNDGGSRKKSQPKFKRLDESGLLSGSSEKRERVLKARRAFSYAGCAWAG